MEKLAIEFFIEDDLVELNTNELLSLNPKQLELNEEELELLRSLQEVAARATYAIDGYFRIEWL